MSPGSEHDSCGEDHNADEEYFDIEVTDEGATAFVNRLEYSSEEKEYEPYSGEP